MYGLGEESGPPTHVGCPQGGAAVFTEGATRGILSGGMRMQHEEHERLTIILVVALTSIIVGGSIDLLMDQPEDWLSFHVVFETLMIAAALVMATTLWMGWWRSAQSVDELRRSLEARSAERDEWRSNAEHALEGLSRAIDGQFDSWGLTPAERDIALLLLKGHSHKAIARHTGRSPQTVRQHAASVYRKGHLSGRAQLAAFFLEDLMLPDKEPDRA
jgi:DNA-binding CsgD family transcriptional regulator